MHRALYRVYRPLQFEDIVGQEHIVSILQNQINEQRINHAYLFCGPRGTGKTSTAKVFAKAVNCISEPKPCYRCPVCEDSDVDIIEMDAASNNSVDNIREMRENVVFAPAVGAYRIYIIDEVHMLSTGAFNALLKILEEPPSHVVFILATTEAHKLPRTVISRCQRFDFQKIEASTIVQKMERILTEEQREFERPALEKIAQKSDGGLRDALSLLDQALGYGEITLANVNAVTGEVEDAQLLALIQAMADKDKKQLFLLLESAGERGVEPKVFLSGMIEFCKKALMQALGIPQEGDEIKKASRLLGVEQYSSLMEALSNTIGEIRYSGIPSVMMEVHLLDWIQKNENITHTGSVSAENDETQTQIRALQQELAQLKEALRSAPTLPRQGGASTKQTKPDYQPAPALGAQELEAKPLAPEEEALLQTLRDMQSGMQDAFRKKKQMPLYSNLANGTLKRAVGGTLYYVFDASQYQFSIDFVSRTESKEMLHRIFSELLEQEIHVQALSEEAFRRFRPEESEELRLIEEQFPDVPIMVHESEQAVKEKMQPEWKESFADEKEKPDDPNTVQ